MANQNITITATDKTAGAFGKVNRNIKSVNTGMTSMRKIALAAGGAIAAIGVGKAITSIVNIGNEIETLELRLQNLFGSAEEGGRAFEVLTEFAGRVPFSLQDIALASGNLAVVADDANELADVLQITGNVAAVTGLDFRTTAEQIQRAIAGGIGSADIFRERGVRALLGFEEGAKVSIEETRKAFIREFGPNGEFGGATDQFAQTLTGTLSMLSDKLFKFQKTIAESFFGELKTQFGDLDQFLEDNEKQITSIATAIGTGLAKALRTVGNIAVFVKDNIGLITGAFVTFFALNAAVKIIQVARAISAVVIASRAAAAITGIGLAAVAASIAAGAVAAAEMNKLLGDVEDDIAQSNANITMLDSATTTLGETVATLTENNEELTESQDDVNESISKAVAIYRALNEQRDEGITGLTNEQNKQIKADLQRKKELDNITKAANIYKILNGQRDEGIIGLSETEKEQIKLNKATEEGTSLIGSFGEGFKSQMLDAVGVAQQLEVAGARAFNRLADSLADFVMTGKLDFKGLANSIISDLIRIAAQAAITFAIKKAASAFGGPFGFLAGFLADGGRAQAGKPFVVGEEGPELFVPKTTGTVISNKDATSTGPGISGGGPVTVNFNIVANDTRGFDELLLSRRATIQGIINGALNQRGKVGVI